jgi:tetratricopeptide (TPR) repeat protein
MKKTILAAIILFTAKAISAQSPEVFYLKGMAALIQDHDEEAFMALSDAIEHNNSDERYYLNRAEAGYRLGKYDQAIDDNEEANSILPGCGNLGLARAYAAKNNTEKAIYYLTLHLRSEYRSSELILTKEQAFNPIKQTDQWYDLWQQDWYNDFDKAEAEVDYLLRKKTPGDALDYINNNMSGFDERAQFYALRAHVCFLDKNYAGAVADYSTALAMDKGNFSYLLNRGLANLNAENLKDAVDDFTKGLRIEPAQFNFYLYRANAFAGLMDFRSAINDVEFYLGFFPEDQDAILLCGEMYYQKEDYINALKYFNKDLKSDPNNPEYYKSRGKTYIKTKTYTYAINDLSMSLDLKPDDGETYLYLGLAKYATGDKTGACSDLQKAQHYGNTLALKYSIEYCSE